MPQMVLGRNFVLRTTSGHAIGFRKNEPVNVPHIVVEAALGIGADFVKGEDKDELNKEVAERPVPPAGDEREKLVFAAFRKMVTEADRENFNGAGYPNMKPLRTIVGFAIDASERNILWERYQQQDNE